MQSENSAADHLNKHPQLQGEGAKRLCSIVQRFFRLAKQKSNQPGI